MDIQQSMPFSRKCGFLLRDVIIISIGLIISSFGTALFYAASLGSSPMATFCDGLHLLLGISYGTANTLANGALLLVLFFLKRSYINVGTLFCVFFIGPFVNLFTGLLTYFPVSQWHFIIRILFGVVGTFLMGLGLGLYVAVQRGYGPLEALVKLLCNKTGASYTTAKILQDVILVAAGMLLHAKWGIGTLIAVFLTGPVLQQSIKFFSGRISQPTASHTNLSPGHSDPGLK